MNDRDRAAAFLGAMINPHLPVIDLHTAGDLRSALEKFDQEFDRVLRTKTRACRVVYGVGEGVLAREIHKKLANNSQIIGWKEEESGGSAVILL